MNKDYLIDDVIKRSQQMILRREWIFPSYIRKCDDNFITVDEWMFGEDGDDILETNTYKWDYSNMGLLPC